MPSRTRSRNKIRAQGTTYVRNRPDRTEYQYYEETWHQTKDVIGKLKRPDGSLPPSFFESNRIYRRPILFSKPNNGTTWYFDGRPCNVPTGPTTLGYPDPGSSQRISENLIWGNRIVAETHPFSPVYSVPVAIKELAEVASMFNFAAKSFAGLLGGYYLNYRFGWLAFYNDVQTLVGITKEIEARAKDFNFMVKHGHTRKRVQLAQQEGETSSSNVTFHSAYSTTIKGATRTEWKLDAWGSVVWSVQSDRLLPLDELSQFNLAAQTAFDLGPMDAATMYQLIPFSWLVDYFFDIGTALQSQVMRYEIQPYDVCIMRHYKQHLQTKVAEKPAAVTINREGYYLREIKTRDFVIPSLRPSLSFDLLRGDRWAVLLALAAKFSSK